MSATYDFPIRIVKELDGNISIYNDDDGEFVTSLSPDIMKITCNDIHIVKVIMDNGSVEYFDPNLVVSTEIYPTTSIPFSGDCNDLSKLLSDYFFNNIDISLFFSNWCSIPGNSIDFTYDVNDNCILAEYYRNMVLIFTKSFTYDLNNNCINITIS